MKKHIVYLVALGLVLVIGCQKEMSFETGGSPSAGSLQADGAGDCLPKTVNGAYIAGTPLVAATNTITVQVNVITLGSYLVYTDTVNGYYFRATGSFTTLGINTVILHSTGTPFAAGVNNFVVNYDSTFCDIQVTVLPAGTGPAVFTLSGAPNACTPSTVNGTYGLGVALTATNTVTISVNVTTIGTFNITTTFQGMTFSKIGVFAATGVQNVTLDGSGTPTTAGTNTVPITVGTSTCSFVITVAGPAAGTLGGAGGACTPSTVNGTYSVGTVLVAANTVQVQVNVTTVGTYSITTNTVTGFSFAASGTFSATGAQTVTLIGTGTPTATGAQTFTVTFGTSTCTFAVNVTGGAVGTLGGAGGTCTPSTVNGTYTVSTVLAAGNTVQVQVNVTSPGAYSITTNTVTGFSFSASGTFAATGIQTVTLNGTGTPTTTGAKTFTVTFGTSTCTFVVNVTGGAVGTLGGSPSTCTPSTVNGTYTVGSILAAGNTVQVQVNVTSPGAYSITTNTVTGFSFSASGTFAATGTQTVTLNGTGTPTTVGPQTFTVTFGTSTCTFVVTVVAAPPIDYFPRTTNSNWSYEYDDNPNDSLLRKVISNTLTAPAGTYNIFMQTADITGGFDSSGYYRKSGGDYFEWIDIAGYIGYDPPPQWVEYVMLKDNVAAGTNWKSAGYSGMYSGTPLTIRFSYTILQKDVPVSFMTSTGAGNYTNVIVVEEKYEQFTGGVWVDVTSQVGYGKSYYARGIGLIKYEAFDQTGALNYQMELRRYQVF